MQGGPGRRFPFRGVLELELPADVELPTCDGCGEVVFNPSLAVAFDAGMERAYLARQRELVAESLEVLCPRYTNQQDLERLLGFSRGYVSKLKAGKESSATNASLLGLIALDPEVRLSELKECWERRSKHGPAHLTVVPMTPSSAPARSAPRSVPSGRTIPLTAVHG